MINKLQLITELSTKTALEITSNYKNWTSFLTTAAWNYKYNFQEQLLIHAQKPTATICASIELWNNFGRWVNKGSKGIALIDDSTNKLRLDHVFDVSDTNSKSNESIRLWEMEHRYVDSVIESMENSFGELWHKQTLSSVLIETAHNAVEDNSPDYLSELLLVAKNSFLKGHKEEFIKENFKETLVNSIAYILLLRCGLDVNKHFGAEDFKDISDFNTSETVAIIGDAASDISQMVLRKIFETIKNIQKSKVIQTHTFAVKELIEYDKNTDQNIERMNEYAQRNLQNAGGLSSSGSSTTTATRNREIWDVTQNISKDAKERDLCRDGHFRQTNESSFRDRQDSQSLGGANYIPDGKVTGSDRNAEGKQSDEVGRDDEQHQNGSRGDSPPRVDLQLEYYNRETEDKSLPFFHSDKLINAILKTSPHISDTKKEITKFFATHSENSDRIEYIKSIFNNDYTELTVDGDRRAGYKTYKNVLQMWEGSFETRISQGFYDWGVIVDYYNGMILLNNLTDTDKPLPSVSQQMLFIETKEEAIGTNAPVAFCFNQEIIDFAILRGSGIEQGKYRIFEQFEKRQSASQNERFLINEYGVGGVMPIISGTGISESHSSKGLGLSMDETNLILTWSKVAKRITELIAADRYLSTKEKEYYPTYLELQETTRQLHAKNKIASKILSIADWKDEPQDSYWDNQYEDDELANIYGGDSVDAQQDIADTEADLNPNQELLVKCDFHLGDTVYFGSNEYNILAFDEKTVRLFDQSFPLINKELSRKNFDLMLRENPLNRHLIVDDFIKENKQQISYASEDKNEEPLDIELIPISNELSHGCVLLHTDNLISDQGITLESGEQELKIANGEEKETETMEPEPIQPESVTPLWEKPKARQRVQSFDLNPQIPISERSNFRITNNELGVGGAKEKFTNNLAAITLLKQLESENRYATPGEQETLSKYVGFGGLSQAFDDKNSSWSNEYLQLKALLDENEYSAARESTLTAFYTSPVVIKAMYKAIENMGFKNCNILEPSCGTGNFLGMLPDSISSSKLFGVELDSITGRIAQQLYQKSSIAVQGFEKTDLPDSFFDIAIGNVPFGQFKVSDKRYDKNNFLIHDYFFAKTLDKVRPGGIVAFITSKGTLDKENSAVRKYIAQRADLLGAIRLPNNAFKANAGTEVTADIIFLQKRDRVIETQPDWIHLGKDENGISMNSYFLPDEDDETKGHPENILGEMVMESTQYGMDSTQHFSFQSFRPHVLQAFTVLSNMYQIRKNSALPSILVSC